MTLCQTCLAADKNGLQTEERGLTGSLLYHWLLYSEPDILANRALKMRILDSSLLELCIHDLLLLFQSYYDYAVHLTGNFNCMLQHMDVILVVVCDLLAVVGQIRLANDS